jgi:lysozyme
MVKGIDLSKWNKILDWGLVAQQVSFVYMKEGQGQKANDPMLESHYKGAKSVGLKVGFYHFATLDTKDIVNDAKAEAANLLQDLKNYKTDLWPVIDVEENGIGLDPKQIELWIKTFVAEFDGKCILYSGAWFLNANLPLDPNFTSTLPLWHSYYPLDKKLGQTKFEDFEKMWTILPKGWKDVAIWQCSSIGRVEGCASLVDINIAKKLYFNGID